jgi:DNA mismatch repair protein MutL
MGHIADIVASIAMGRPDVQFKLLHNRKIVKNWSLASDPLERVIDILGKDIKNYLRRIESKDNNLSISGWISSPRFTRKTSRGIYVYVNGRFVRDRVIQHALFDGYRERLVKGQFPLAVLFMHIPFNQVDVNVHPTKNEIRFVNERKVHEKVSTAVWETLKLSDRTKWASPKFQQEEKHYISESVAEFRRQTTEDGGQKTEVRGQTTEDGRRKTEDGRQRTGDRGREAEGGGQRTDDGRRISRFDLPVKQEALWEKKQFGDLRVIGQLQSTYILCESDEGLVLIDQHAAHERILFEQLKNRSKAHKVASQRLLIPETLDVGYKEAEILNKLIPELTELGLDIEPFGGNTFVIKSVPALIINREIKPVLIGLLEKLVETGFSSGFDKTIEQCLILMACHGAIRANQHLTEKQMKVLLEQLDECDNPSHCPHGRPTWIKWTTRLIEKSFNRIV